MIPRKSEHTLEVQGNVSTKKMTIAANAVAFRALIDGMYADKIGSIMRELWTNAWDAQVEAGLTDKPFEVRLPTSLNPSFHVRDFGVSMPHDIVMEVFTTMFESTKRESNAVAGKFGVGSKSPFAYTDAYTVTCFLDGEVRIYSVHIGSDGSPEVALMQRGETEEPNGLMVAFPVEKDDFAAFRKAAARTSLGFDVKPIINVGDDVFMDLPEIELEHENWKLYKKTEYRIGLRIKMGCVTYPIDREFFSDEMDSKIGDANLTVEVPIGACDVNLSREALSYDDETVVNLQTAFSEAIQSIEDFVAGSLTDATSYRDACTRYEKALETLKTIGIDSDGLSCFHKGIPARTKTWLPVYWTHRVNMYTRRHFTANRPTTSLSKNDVAYFSSDDSIQTANASLYVFSKQGQNTPYLGDRIKQYLEDIAETSPHIRFVKRIELRSVMIPCRDTLKTVLLDIPDNQIVFADELPFDRSRIPAPVEGETPQANYHYMLGGTYRCQSRIRDDIECYVLTAGAHRPDSVHYNKTFRDRYNTVLSAFDSLGWNPVVIHLPKKDRELKDKLDLPDFYDLCQKKIKEVMSGDQFHALLAYDQEISDYYSPYHALNRSMKDLQEEIDVLQYLEESSGARPLFEFLDMVSKCEQTSAYPHNSSRLIKRISEVSTSLGLPESDMSQVEDHKARLRGLYDKFDSEYPMVRLFHYRNVDEATPWGHADFIDYLNSK